jgi:hypothetical protein
MKAYDIMERELSVLEEVDAVRPSVTNSARLNHARWLWIIMHSDPLFKLASFAHDPTGEKMRRRTEAQWRQNGLITAGEQRGRSR